MYALQRFDEAQRELLPWIDTMVETPNAELQTTQRRTPAVEQWLPSSKMEWERGDTADNIRILVEQCNARGNKLYAEHRFRDALIWFTREVRLRIFYLDNTETIIDTLGRPSVAGKKVIRMDRQLSVAYFNRANTYDELTEYAEAIADYQWALDCGNASPWDVLNNRAHVYEKMGELVRAESDLDQAIAVAQCAAPNIEAAYNRVAIKLLLSGEQTDRDRIKARLHRLYESRPDLAKVWDKVEPRIRAADRRQPERGISRDSFTHLAPERSSRGWVDRLRDVFTRR